MKNEVTILIVDDDDVDVEDIRRALTKLRIANPVRVAVDGVDALEILRGENGAEKLELPYLIILDINMPRMNGLEFLREIRADPALRRSIVFVLTTSDDERDRTAAYDKNVAGYILKTDPVTTLDQALSMLNRYWRLIEFPD